MTLKTDYTVEAVPHAEHPCPQAERADWLCLNGAWTLRVLDREGRERMLGEIRVPFSPETANADFADPFVLAAGETLVYSRRVNLTESLLRGCTLLHFGAVDSVCTVFWNGIRVGEHRGGFTAFAIDVTAHARLGENEICVECRDEATRNGWTRGKQCDRRGGIWYTPQSGIWQTAWLESMPKKHICDLKITPDAENRTVKIKSDSFGEWQTVTVYDRETEIIKERYQNEVVLSYDFALWSPEDPKLYTFVLTNESGDRVKSYFGVRSFGKMLDQNGKMRLTLNGKPCFFNGVLDQGYWSDGLLTYPSDSAAYDELKMLKDMGFNTVRKHIKVEPMRWYYHCDRLGLLVWQDFVNGGGEYKFTHVAAFPFLGFHHKDSDYRYFAREDAEAREEYLQTAAETLSQLYNCTCIAMWVPFNEGWGQFDSAKMTEWVREKDPTRLIDSVSGWHDQGVGKTELRSLHTYYTPLRVPKDLRPVVLSEFGGYSMKVSGHVYDESREFGYKKFKTQEALVEALRVLYLEKLKPLIAEGLCGAIYTQVSDVEEEINGLVTYDRKVIKIPVDEMRRINDEIHAVHIE